MRSCPSSRTACLFNFSNPLLSIKCQDFYWEKNETEKTARFVKGEELKYSKKRALETVSVSSKEEHQPTAISSADGAKIIENLESIANKFENISNRPNLFIGLVADALGAQRFGSSSRYATFETKNGKIITIRLDFYWEKNETEKTTKIIIIFRVLQLFLN